MLLIVISSLFSPPPGRNIFSPLLVFPCEGTSTKVRLLVSPPHSFILPQGRGAAFARLGAWEREPRVLGPALSGSSLRAGCWDGTVV